MDSQHSLNKLMQLRNLLPLRNYCQFFITCFFLILLFLGIFIYKDFGVSADEMTQRAIGQTSLTYLANLFGIAFLLDGATPLIDPASVFLSQRDRDYGVAFELPAEFFAKVLHLGSRDAYYFRHLLTFLVFYVAVYFFYRLIRLRYDSWRMGLLGATFLILSPRIFGDSFFNDKDLVFLSVFLIGIYTLVQFILKPNWRNALWHALACAIAIDVRLMAVLLPAATLAALLMLSLRQALPIKIMLSLLGLYSVLLVVFVIAFWPWLWLDPVGHFLLAFRNMAHFRHNPEMYFMGQIISAKELPWYYIPVWIGVTTPIIYSLLFCMGLGVTLKQVWTNGRRLWSTKQELQDLIFLGLFIAPLLAVIVLHSVLYNGWRQMYFLYPAFLLVAVRGWVWIWAQCHSHQRRRNGVALVLVACLGYTGYWMIRWHPHQYLYFNVLAGEFAKRFDVDYWAVAYKPILEKIVAQNPKRIFPLYIHPAGGTTWGVWQLDHQRNLYLLPTANVVRIISDRSEACSDYVITTLMGNRTQYLGRPEFAVFDELKINGQIVYTTFKRQVVLDEQYAPAIGKVIAFNSPNTQCFLKQGWGGNENWGVWSVRNEAKLRLRMPPGKPQSLVLDLRAFIGPQQTNQVLEWQIDGGAIQKNVLTQFERNLIKIPIPPSAYGKDWIDVSFKIPNAISPKALGQGVDDRLLGIGLKQAVFE